MSKSIKVPVKLAWDEVICMEIYEESPDSIRIINEQEANENGESPYQLKEGMFYEFKLPEGYVSEESVIIQNSKINSSRGRINTNIYVGTFKFYIYKEDVPDEPVASVTLEIQSVKTGYREDYRKMLEDITIRCTDLLLRQSSPVSQTFIVNINSDSQTLYQRFAFVESLIRTESFADAIHRINIMPVKRWEIVESSKGICNVKRVNRSIMKQIITRPNRTILGEQHHLKKKFESLPNYVNTIDKRETTDIPENRFIKHVLKTFLQFTLSIYLHPNAGEKLKREALTSSELLEKYMSLPVFREISQLDSIQLNSPVLQRKEGYREILQSYLMFDMAASLVWKGGENVYHGGKRDVAVLYEYWLFFELLELIELVFRVKPFSVDNLIEPTNENTLELTLKQGNLKMVDGIFEAYNRKFHLEFCYNRTFKSTTSYPSAGSWTRNMRPDYTFSIWPESLTRQQAEEQEMIVHLHFDAKYKIENFQSLFEVKNLDEEKEEEAKGNYKRGDLLKMHAYKDAIRRTAGAYILYPGAKDDTYSSFHEILPGLGAFSISPSNKKKAGLKQFLQDIVLHFANRTSQRTLFSYHTFKTFEKELRPEINDKLPLNEYEFPKTTYVLVGYYKNQEHLDWILKNKLYNVRTDNRMGSLKLSVETIGARYLLLHTKGDFITNKIYSLDPAGPHVISKEFMMSKQYSSGNIYPYYIGYDLQSSIPLHDEFGHIQWDVRLLPNYNSARKSAYPFTVTLEELMYTKYL